VQRYILRRLLQGVVLLFVLALVIFALARVTGNPADLLLPEDATADDRAHLLRALGLDRPVHEQLVNFLSGAVRGDLGVSIRYRKPAVEVFFERLPNTLMLVPLALVVAIVVSIPLGLLAAVYRGTFIDRVCSGIAVPSARMGGPTHYILPTITLGAFLVAGMMRLVRSSVLEILDSEFVKLARIKGL
jgi:peptide/nickel transport system permease protein